MGERYNGPASSFDYAYAVAVSPGGDKVFVIASSTNNPDNPDYPDSAAVTYRG